MAGQNKVYCPKCGASSTKEGFGQEPTRASCPMSMVYNPATAVRRNKAAAIRRQNRKGK